MEVVEANPGVQKSSTAIAESSQEVSIEKTAIGSIEKAISSQSKIEQSVVQQKSITKSSSVSVSSTSSHKVQSSSTSIKQSSIKMGESTEIQEIEF